MQWTGALVVLAGGVALAAAQETARVTVQGAGCAATPAGAIRAAKGVAGALQLSQVEGYRVRTVRWDTLQGQGWAVVERCAHPELPAIAMLTDLPAVHPALGVGEGGTAAAGGDVSSAGTSLSATIIRTNAAVTVVKAGETVRLWKRDGRASIELVATAEENGVVGARVRVRLTMPKETNGQTAPPQFLAGVVRGPADVEIEP